MSSSGFVSKAGVVLGLLSTLGLTACHEKTLHHEEEGTYTATTPLCRDTDIVREYVCQIRSIQHIEMRTLESGYLEDVFVDEGQFVKKGQRMFQVLTLIYEAELARANAEAEFARIEVENSKRLLKGNVVATPDLALAEAKYSKAKAEAQLASAHMSLTEIKAPFDGIMDRLHVRKGSFLEEGELLTSLSDNSKMWVYFNVTEAEYLDYQARHDRGEKVPVELRMANGKTFDHTGVVDTIEGEFNNSTGTIAFRATFPNPSGLLRHGQTGEVLLSKTYDRALLIPQKATFEILDKKYVFVLDDEDRVRSREITIAAEKPHLYVVSSGLNGDERILVEGLRRVRDGQKVHVDLEPPEDVFATLDVPAK